MVTSAVTSRGAVKWLMNYFKIRIDGRRFGGKFVIFGENFCQVSSVIKYASLSKIILSILKSTPMWTKRNQFILTKYIKSSDKVPEVKS